MDSTEPKKKVKRVRVKKPQTIIIEQGLFVLEFK